MIHTSLKIVFQDCFPSLQLDQILKLQSWHLTWPPRGGRDNCAKGKHTQTSKKTLIHYIALKACTQEHKRYFVVETTKTHIENKLPCCIALAESCQHPLNLSQQLLHCIARMSQMDQYSTCTQLGSKTEVVRDKDRGGQQVKHGTSTTLQLLKT